MKALDPNCVPKQGEFIVRATLPKPYKVPAFLRPSVENHKLSFRVGAGIQAHLYEALIDVDLTDDERYTFAAVVRWDGPVEGMVYELGFYIEPIFLVIVA